MHSSIVSKVTLQEDNGNVSEENATSEETQKSLSWYKKALGFFSKAGRRKAAAGDGSAEVSFLGFVYQVW